MEEKISSINFDNICRLCLKTTQDLFSLFSDNLSDMLAFCELWSGNKCNRLPQNICGSCKELLRQSYEFKQQCISSKLTLDKIIGINDETDKTATYLNKETNDSEEILTTNETGLLYVTKIEPLCFSDEDIDNDEKADISSTNEQTVEMGNKPNLEMGERLNNKYCCDKCNQIFVFEKDAALHQSIHSANLTCNNCEKTFSTKKKLQRHIKSHMIAKRHKCETCGKDFCELAALKKHIKFHHRGVPRDKNYCCADCGKRFTDKYYLSLHVRKHTGEKPLSCNFCHKAFYDPRSLKVHVKAHKGNKSYKCSYCGKSFVQSSHLKNHLVVHTNEKSFVCDVCYRKFTQSSSLQRHKKLHLGDKK